MARLVGWLREVNEIHNSKITNERLLFILSRIISIGYNSRQWKEHGEVFRVNHDCFKGSSEFIFNALKKQNISIGDLIDKIFNQLKNKRETIFKNIDDWEVLISKDHVREIVNIKERVICKEERWKRIEKEEIYQWIKEKLVNQIFRTIKNNPQEWKIVKYCKCELSPDETGDTFITNKKISANKKTRRKYWKAMFTDQEFTELTSIILSTDENRCNKCMEVDSTVNITTSAKVLDYVKPGQKTVWLIIIAVVIGFFIWFLKWLSNSNEKR